MSMNHKQSPQIGNGEYACINDDAGSKQRGQNESNSNNEIIRRIDVAGSAHIAGDMIRLGSVDTKNGPKGSSMSTDHKHATQVDNGGYACVNDARNRSGSMEKGWI